ncbi:HEPN domain-containing protein [Pseudomonas sp. EL_65y_Pfl2_R96]|uniref:HEPN domain-containing protein n=1 Tax=Pseudomonas sp. EL_65y_Pfl2_R96 TaxID=3088699 RepID=UPI0030DC5786
MNDWALLTKYENLYISLRGIIKESENRVLSNNPDNLFIDNVNFFVKSYLITICTYLESFLQDLALKYAKEISLRIKKAEIPHNFVYWRLAPEVKDKDLKFLNIDLSINKKEISDNLSANPYRTVKLFRYLGVDLTSEEDFESNKGLVNSIVAKRNNIVHHNDKAMDISFSDLLAYIDIFTQYMNAIDMAICKKIIPV